MNTWGIANEEAAGDPPKLDSTKFAAAMGAAKDHHAYLGTACHAPTEPPAS